MKSQEFPITETTTLLTKNSSVDEIGERYRLNQTIVV